MRHLSGISMKTTVKLLPWESFVRPLFFFSISFNHYFSWKQQAEAGSGNVTNQFHFIKEFGWGAHFSHRWSYTYSTVCGYKFNHLVANLTTLTAFTSASFRGQPWGLEERLRNKKCRQVTNLVPCFWNFQLPFFIWIIWGFKDGHIKKNCSFWRISVDLQQWMADFF